MAGCPTTCFGTNHVESSGVGRWSTGDFTVGGERPSQYWGSLSAANRNGLPEAEDFRGGFRTRSSVPCVSSVMPRRLGLQHDRRAASRRLRKHCAGKVGLWTRRTVVEVRGPSLIVTGCRSLFLLLAAPVGSAD